MQSSLLVALILLAHPPPPSSTVILTAKCEVSACPECADVPADDEVFPSMFFIEAIPVPLPDEIMPDVLDLRAFATLQNHFGMHRGHISGRMHTFANLYSSIGQLPFTSDLIRQFDAVMRWVPLQIIPRRPAPWWCDFDRDNDVDLDDFAVLLGRWFAGASVGGGDDG